MEIMTTNSQVNVATAATHANSEDERLRALMARVVSRDSSALPEIYDITAARIFAVALRMTHQTEAAEDIVADVFSQVWQTGKQYNPDNGRVMTWLLRQCRLLALDWLRSNNKAMPHVTESPRTGIATSADRESTLTDAFQFGSKVYSAIATLSERERDLLAMAFFRGLTYQEIAQQTTLSLGAVASAIKKALATLRAHSHHGCSGEEPI